MVKKVAVIGAGFKGFCSCLRLLENPENEVYLVDSSKNFGGVMNSRKVGDFYIDNGVHMFDSIQRELADIITEIMDGKTKEVDFTQRSCFNGKVTDGFALPDLASLDDEKVKQKIKEELVELSKQDDQQGAATTLFELFKSRYGETVANYFHEIFQRVYGASSHEVEPDAIKHTSLGRLKFLDDDQMLALKEQDGWLDSVLAARRKSMGKIDDLISIYPTDGRGMYGFCQKAHAWLEDKGVKVLLGQRVQKLEETADDITLVIGDNSYKFDHVIWTNEDKLTLSTLVGMEPITDELKHPTPLSIISLFTKAENICDFTYMQNFDMQGISYRSSSAGIYSEQINDEGISFITCECPVVVDSDMWNNPNSYVDDIWQECQRLGIIKEGAELKDVDILSVKKSFTPPYLGFSKVVSELDEFVTQRYKRLTVMNLHSFFRREIYDDCAEIQI